MKRRFVLSILYIAAGALLFVLGCINNGDGSLCGAGGGLLGVGAVFLIRNVKYRTNPEYREKTDTAEKDERNIMIWTKARSLTFSVYAVIAGIAIIVLYTVNMEYAAQVIAYNLCGVLVIYWICYFIIRNKY